MPNNNLVNFGKGLKMKPQNTDGGGEALAACDTRLALGVFAALMAVPCFVWLVLA